MKNFPRWLLPVIALVAVFLLTSTALYISGKRSSAYVETNGAVVQIAGRARLEWHKTLRYIFELKFGDQAQKDEAILALRTGTAFLSQSITALQEGGAVDISKSIRIALPPDALAGDAKAAIDEISDKYRELNGRLAPIIAVNNPESGAVNRVFDYALSVDQSVSPLLNQMIGSISFSSFDAASKLGRLQLIATVLGTLFIATLIALYSLQLKKLGAAKKETDEILQTVPAGLFLLDKNMKLGAQHSAQLEKILGQRHIAGRDFASVFGSLADADTLSTAQDYIALLIADQVDENLIADVNPLDQVGAVITNESGRSESRHLGFGFKRVLDNGKLSHLLVTVSDITDRIQLAAQVNKLEKQMDQNAGQTIELISSILSMERPVLLDRIARYEQLLDDANTHLKDSGKGNITYRGLVDQVFRPLHTLKGETAALGFKLLASGASDMESELVLLKQKTDLTGNDFLGVTLKLDELYDRLNKLRQLVAKIPQPASIQEKAMPNLEKPIVAPVIKPIESSKPATVAPVTHSASPAAPMTALRFDFALIQQACIRTAEKLGKKVSMQGQNLSAASVPDPLKQTMTDVLVQLVRNALAHGIESPSERLQSGKIDTGQITVQFSALAEGGHELVFRDDGRGLDFESIRERAIQLQRLTPEAARALEPRQLAGFIFEPGFSTAAKANDTAGLGVGLDVVMVAVKKAGGRIAVGTQPGQYTQFRVRFPSV
jgi:two-component system, chemotaxis family, sensor kinase CheA